MKDKFVVITGGTGGLGVAVIRGALAAGARCIVLPYRTPKNVDELKPVFTQEESLKLQFIQCDLNDETSIESIFQAMPRVDVLVHLVGGFQIGRTDEFSVEDWQKMFDLNLNSIFLLCKGSLRRMRETGYGRIVTVGSRAVEQPGAQLAAYSASKAGVVSLMRSIAEETKDKELDITANSVLPSIIDTPKNRQDLGEDTAWQWVSPESLAGVICFLASEAAKDIRGAAIPVYGKA